MEGTYLMNGVEVLSQSQNVSSIGTTVGVILLVIGAFLLIFGVFESDGACMMIGIVCLMLCFVAFSESTEDTDVLYKVVISEEVKLSEFNERYKIISQEGKIYTVKERK